MGPAAAALAAAAMAAGAGGGSGLQAAALPGLLRLRCTAAGGSRLFSSLHVRGDGGPASAAAEGPASSPAGGGAHAKDAGTRGGASGSGGAGDVPEGCQLVYEGFFARPHKRLKYASLLNTFASFAAAPLIVGYAPASAVARVAVTTSVVAFALLTTAALHWFTAPYVHRLLLDPRGGGTLRAQTLGLLGRTRWREFPLSAVQQPDSYHPLSSFTAEGRAYYVDRATFRDRELLARLMPWAEEQEEGGGGQAAAAAGDPGARGAQQGAAGGEQGEAGAHGRGA